MAYKKAKPVIEEPVFKSEDIFNDTPKRGPGRPLGSKTSPDAAGANCYAPTDKDIEDVCVMVANEVPQNIMASMLDISVSTLRKYFKTELALGKIMANARIAISLYAKAKNGDVRALQFWLKNKDKWVETNSVELTGKDGADLMNPTERTQRLANLLMSNPEVAKQFKKDKPLTN